DEMHQGVMRSPCVKIRMPRTTSRRRSYWHRTHMPDIGNRRSERLVVNTTGKLSSPSSPGVISLGYQMNPATITATGGTIISWVTWNPRTLILSLLPGPKCIAAPLKKDLPTARNNGGNRLREQIHHCY